MELPLVLLQIKVPTESLPARLAGVRFPFCVGVHVEGQIVDLVEGLVADFAFEGLVPTVRQLVILVVALLVEAFPAVLADERFVAVVDTNVGVERGAPIKGLPAGLTLVRFFRRVDDFMSAERRGLAKALPANFANERPSSRVDRHVAGQIVMSIEDLSALLTSEGLVIGIIV
jgi:hypothetical protein